MNALAFTSVSAWCEGLVAESFVAYSKCWGEVGISAGNTEYLPVEGSSPVTISGEAQPDLH